MFSGRNLIVLIAAVLAAGLLGFALGSSRTAGVRPEGSQEATPTTAESKEGIATPTQNKVVKYVTQSVSGKVKSVSGKTIVVEEGGDSLSFEVAPEARITRITVVEPTALPEEGPVEPKQETITLEDITVGSNIDAQLASQPDGTFMATEVTVLVEAE